MILNQTLSIRMGRDNKHFWLLEFLYCTDKWGDQYRMKIGSPSDGMSGGKFVNLCFEDDHTFYESVFHDGCYGDNIEKLVNGEWIKCTLTQDQSDQLFLENMLDAGEPYISARTIYEGVHLFGKSSFEDDRARLNL